MCPTVRGSLTYNMNALRALEVKDDVLKLLSCFRKILS